MSGIEMREGGGAPVARALLSTYARRLPKPSFRLSGPSLPAVWRTVILVLAVVTILWGALMAVAAG
ncbi:hypothetical protein AB0A69_23820 [Streptomyces sp. NPDC045431]|uniref:hypothetical protein n=1 Tax=Streptomyces sp. NPDC045431 TaxID=3155613 RepID=UPI003407A183